LETLRPTATRYRVNLTVDDIDVDTVFTTEGFSSNVEDVTVVFTLDEGP
jgi:hypothetical protein